MAATPEELLETAPPSVSAEEAAEIAERHYGITGEVKALQGERDRNFLVAAAGGGYVLKVANPAERRSVLEMQQAGLAHIARCDPDLPVPRPVATPAGQWTAAVSVGGTATAARVETFLPGERLADGFSTGRLRRGVAEVLARLDRALRGFFHPEAGRGYLWDVTRLGRLRPHAVHLPGERRRIVEEQMDQFERRVAPALPALRAQVVHGDLNPANLLVDPSDPERIVGILDFGDLMHAPLIVDPAVAAAYQCLGADDPGAVIADLTGAYRAHLPLEEGEVELIPDLATARLAQSLTISAWRAAVHRDNRDYILIHADPAWEALRRLIAAGSGDLVDAVREACGYPPRRRSRTGGLDATLERRRRVMGPGMRISYDTPLHAVSAAAVWLRDADGAEHLDAYNNVAHVGHGRPEVVAALSRQAALLNTNTRYLVDGVIDYADRIAGMFPAGLDVVVFANSGSEANDLAWRMARTVTGRAGTIVTEHAYHGATALTIATSPEEEGVDRLEPWVATVPAPDTFRGRYAGEGDPASAASADVAGALSRLASGGHGAAAFACDTVWASDGIFEPPHGYLASVYETTRAAGALCIADEVQAGFGRVGSRMWGFAGHGVVPDIVTLGKPMGNGHPIAAVVTSAAIAAAFSERSHYFSTFAGNPVSAAVGMAVLDVMEAERLPERADVVGAYLRSGLRDLAASHPEIGDVRGPGMFVGVEIVDAAGAPDAAAANRIQNAMRERRVLIGRTGRSGNVLKIRPPLVFDESHADLLLGVLGGVLSDLAPG